MVAAHFVFSLMFWAYGVVPHQWLTWAGNELSWRPDTILFAPGQWDSIFGIDLPGTFPPFTMNNETLAHIIVVRSTASSSGSTSACSCGGRTGATAKALATVPTSGYGRPLVRKAQ